MKKTIMSLLMVVTVTLSWAQGTPYETAEEAVKNMRLG